MNWVTNLEVFFEFFKNSNSDNVNPSESANADFPNVEIDNNLNEPITEEEITKAIKSLKNGKAAGLDKITNEYIKSSSEALMTLYHRLFNKIFDTGFVPESWLIGCILPIFKNKGDTTDPQNYRPITILSCIGKLFTAVLNNRLSVYLENNNLINENQAGFRKQHSTVDHIFVIQILAEICKKRNRKLFCCFIDFQKAFDSVWRAGLWCKLTCYNINGKMLNIIKNMYNGIKSYICK